MIDLYNAALKTRTPYSISIVDSTHYRNGSSKTYSYPGCKLEFDSRSARGEATTKSLRWKSGEDRIAS